MRRCAVVGLAVAFVAGLPPPGGFADPVCVYAEVWGTDVPDDTVGTCVPTPYPVTCRFFETGLEPRVEVRVTTCPPRV